MARRACSRSVATSASEYPGDGSGRLVGSGSGAGGGVVAQPTRPSSKIPVSVNFLKVEGCATDSFAVVGDNFRASG